MRKTIAIVAGVVLAVAAWVFTAPYPGNTGWQRTPGVIIGGELTEAPSDLTNLAEDQRGTMMMKLDGFPPFSIYINYALTPDYVISATRPDGGYWAQRVRDRGGDGLLRFGDNTYEMTATEVTGEDRLPLLELWGGGPESLDSLGGPGRDPLRDWEVFLWRAR